MSGMITDNIDAYMSRDWDAVRRWKDEYCAERIARLGPMEAFRIAEGLRQQALWINPSWPSPAERREDLAAHERLAEAFRRAAAATRH
jgi:hypothetical protein